MVVWCCVDRRKKWELKGGFYGNLMISVGLGWVGEIIKDKMEI
jgi:hypothetical protein